ncbi:MAG TPA: trehalose-phosphatase [Verrucomicrobiae bacterium]|nr:trehalose-phosphatase [Verrucomicrobiae bacterium]
MPRSVGVGRPAAEELALRLRPAVEAGRCLIASDFDGTLAPIVADPTRAAMLPSARRALERLVSRTPVAVVSGRHAALLARLCPIPGVILVGSYGLERWQDGAVLPHPRALAWRGGWAHDFEEVTAAVGCVLRHAPRGVRIVRKPWGVAVHLREVAGPRVELERHLAVELRILARRFGLRLGRGRLVLELLPPVRCSKGTALADLLRTLRPQAAVFAGDDRGDVPALRLLARDRARLAIALGLAVSGPETPPALLREATSVLAGPTVWAALLHRLAAGLSPPRGRAGPGAAG